MSSGTVDTMCCSIAATASSGEPDSIASTSVLGGDIIEVIEAGVVKPHHQHQPPLLLRKQPHQQIVGAPLADDSWNSSSARTTEFASRRAAARDMAWILARSGSVEHARRMNNLTAVVSMPSRTL
jgi:hypothetical protein